jgi:hypothetical protein
MDVTERTMSFCAASLRSAGMELPLTSARAQADSLTLQLKDVPVTECIVWCWVAAFCRDAAAANVSLKSGVPWQPITVADAAGPHFNIMRQAIQSAWKLSGPHIKPVPVLPVLLPGGKQHLVHHCSCGQS